MISEWVKRLRRLFLFNLTPVGRYFYIGLIICTIFGSPSIDMPIYRLFCVLASLAAVVVTIGWWYRPRVRVSGSVPERASAGQTVEAEFRLTNVGRRTIYDLGLGFLTLPDAFESSQQGSAHFRLDASETVNSTLAIRPLRRGLYTLERLTPYSSFPFGIWRTSARPVSAGSILVLPSFHPLTEVELPTSFRYQPGGIALTSNVGESPEYIGSRDYRPGDSWRRIDFRSWARLARPAVREYHEEYYFRVALVLDTFVPGRGETPPAGFPELEAAVSFAAAVADALTRGECVIDLFAAGPELYVFRAGRHISHFDSVLEILACVDACRTNPFETVTPALADELGAISTVVVILLDWDDSRRALLRTAREAGCEVKAFVVRDAATTLPIHGEDGIDVRELRLADICGGGVGAV